jgi:hypothetical protein
MTQLYQDGDLSERAFRQLPKTDSELTFAEWLEIKDEVELSTSEAREPAPSKAMVPKLIQDMNSKYAFCLVGDS